MGLRIGPIWGLSADSNITPQRRKKDPPLSNTAIYLFIAPQLWELAKKVNLALIGSWPRTFQRAIEWDEPCTLPLTPKGWHKTRVYCFASKIQLLSKEVCYEVSLCENVQRQSYSYIFLYLTVHRWIAGDVPIYLKFALKVTNPFRKF